MERILKEEYSIKFSVEDTKNLEVVDPSSVKTKDGEYLMLTETAVRQMASTYEMGSKKFSNDLYTMDQIIWKELLDKKRISNNVISNLENSKSLIVGDIVINITDSGNKLPLAVEAVNSYINTDLVVYNEVNPDDNTVTLLAIDSDGVGNLIKFYLESNWITVYDCLYKESSRDIIIIPNPEFDGPIDEDTAPMASHSICYQASLGTIPDNAEDVINRLHKTMLSEEEIVSFLKKNLGLKLKIDQPDVLDFCTKKNYSSMSYDCINDIISKLYRDDEFIKRINCHWMKRAVYFTNISYLDLVNLISNLLIDGLISMEVLSQTTNNCMKGETHYHHLYL